MSVRHHNTGQMKVADKIAALNRVLADATVECRRYKHGERAAQGESREKIGPCAKCHGTGRIARFSGFRQECNHRTVVVFPCPKECTDDEFHIHSGGKHMDDCRGCNGLGWQVRAGGLEDGLAGLSFDEKWGFFMAVGKDAKRLGVLTDRAEILAEGLRLVCEIAGLEVPDAYLL